MKSITCLMLVMFCAHSNATVIDNDGITPIDGLYTNLFGGYVYLPSNVNHSFNNYNVSSPSYQPGFEAGGSVGYKSNPMRYEGEITYLKANLKNFNVDNTAQTSTNGYSQAVLGMANIYYDVSSLHALLQPFLGAGIGYGWFQGQLNSTAPTSIAFRAENGTFAYQGIAGITFNFAENYALNLNYRYISTLNLGSFGERFQAHIANVGATYRFDIVKYK